MCHLNWQNGLQAAGIHDRLGIEWRLEAYHAIGRIPLRQWRRNTLPRFSSQSRLELTVERKPLYAFVTVRVRLARSYPCLLESLGSSWGCDSRVLRRNKVGLVSLAPRFVETVEYVRHLLLKVYWFGLDVLGFPTNNFNIYGRYAHLFDFKLRLRRTASASASCSDVWTKAICRKVRSSRTFAATVPAQLLNVLQKD